MAQAGPELQGRFWCPTQPGTALAGNALTLRTPVLPPPNPAAAPTSCSRLTGRPPSGDLECTGVFVQNRQLVHSPRSYPQKPAGDSPGGTFQIQVPKVPPRLKENSQPCPAHARKCRLGNAIESPPHRNNSAYVAAAATTTGSACIIDDHCAGSYSIGLNPAR